MRAAYGPQSSLENPRVPLQPVPDMAQGVEWALIPRVIRLLEIPIPLRYDYPTERIW